MHVGYVQYCMLYLYFCDYKPKFKDGERGGIPNLPPPLPPKHLSQALTSPPFSSLWLFLSMYLSIYIPLELFLICSFSFFRSLSLIILSLSLYFFVPSIYLLVYLPIYLIIHLSMSFSLCTSTYLYTVYLDILCWIRSKD